jgi:hypothetical protein
VQFGMVDLEDMRSGCACEANVIGEFRIELQEVKADQLFI